MTAPPRPTAELAAPVLEQAAGLFRLKTLDYGTAWRILRPASLTDQLWIKASRIRAIDEAGRQLVDDPIEDDFTGILNYALMALIQLDLAAAGDDRLELPADEAEALYRAQQQRCLDLMARKDHDYGQAWRQMRVGSITDMILMKLLRLRQLEAQGGQGRVSEGLAAGYQDIANYAVFALLHLRGQA